MYFEQLKPSQDSYVSVFYELKDQMAEEILLAREEVHKQTQAAALQFNNETVEKLGEIQTAQTDAQKDIREKSDAYNSRTVTILLFILLVGSLTIAALILFISSLLTKRMSKIAFNLSKDSGRTLSSTGELEKHSQSLLEAASKQSASIGQISSSIGNINNMAQGTENYCSQAADLSANALEQVNEAIQKMQSMNQALTKCPGCGTGGRGLHP